MNNPVFINGLEVACKAGEGTVVAFPDPCWSPPGKGMIAAPYAVSAQSAQMHEGSQSVQVAHQEVMLRDQSFYQSKQLGDEAATAKFGRGLATAAISGRTYFAMWSMDVKIEGENADRAFDLTTSNHAVRIPGNTPPSPNLGRVCFELE